MSWADVYYALAKAPPGTSLAVKKSDIARPVGALPSVGIGAGEHYRFPPDKQCRGLHVRDEGGDSYDVHLDQVHPDCSVVSHLREDAPALFVALGAVIGGVLGGIAKGSGGAVIGGACGMTGAALLTRS